MAVYPSVDSLNYLIELFNMRKREMFSRALLVLLVLALIALPVFAGNALEGKKAPDFTLKDISGKRVALKDMLAKGPVLIDFWATWCAPCKQAFPHLKVIHEKYKEQGFNLLAISIDNTRSVSKVRPFAKSQGWDFPVLLDTNSEVLKKYRGSSVPHTVLLDENGMVVKVWIGYHAGEEVEIDAEVQKLVDAVKGK